LAEIACNSEFKLSVPRLRVGIQDSEIGSADDHLKLLVGAERKMEPEALENPHQFMHFAKDVKQPINGAGKGVFNCVLKDLGSIGWDVARGLLKVVEIPFEPGVSCLDSSASKEVSDCDKVLNVMR
jgi:hypothetical protein